MKLNPRTVHPENGTMCFAINDVTITSFWRYKHSSGFVGVILFEDGKWYSFPGKVEIDNTNDFLWIELYDQPERSKREDSQKCEMRCSEHCGNTVRDK